MRVVVDAHLQLLPWSEENEFHSNLSQQIAQGTKEKGAMKIEDEDHYFLMEAARQRTTLYEVTVYGSLEDDVDSDDDARSVDEDQEVSDTDEDVEQSDVD